MLLISSSDEQENKIISANQQVYIFIEVYNSNTPPTDPQSNDISLFQ